MNLHRLWVSRAAHGALSTSQPPVTLPMINALGFQIESHVQSYGDVGWARGIIPGEGATCHCTAWPILSSRE